MRSTRRNNRLTKNRGEKLVNIVYQIVNDKKTKQWLMKEISAIFNQYTIRGLHLTTENTETVFFLYKIISLKVRFY